MKQHDVHYYFFVKMRYIMINLLCFADDMVLLAPSWSGLHILIAKLHQLGALAINMTFIVSKTVCRPMIFKPVNSRYAIS